MAIPMFVDRNVQYPDRYTDELGNVKTFTPSPGTVTEAGTPINAVNMNAIGSQLKRLAGSIALGGIIG